MHSFLGHREKRKMAIPKMGPKYRSGFVQLGIVARPPQMNRMLIMYKSVVLAPGSTW